MPEISIVVPAYNVEKYIAKCIDSLLVQTYENFEILLVDDGASDQTPEICDRLALKDSRIRVFHKKNGGLSDARNYGIERMTGKFLTFVDGDDYVSEDYLNTLHRMINKRSDVQIAMISGQELSENERPVKVSGVKERVLSSEQAVKKMLLRDEITHSSWGKLFRSELWSSIRFPVGQNYEDYATTYHVFSLADKIVFSNQPLYYYIQHSNSIMHQTCSEKTLSVLRISDIVTEFIIKQWPETSVEALELQTAVYLKNMQTILNCGFNCFEDYQKKITNTIKKNAKILLIAKQVPVKDKVKILAFLAGKRSFIKIYNVYNGDKIIKNEDMV